MFYMPFPMSTLPLNFRYKVQVDVADGAMPDPPSYGFLGDYSLASIKEHVNKSLRAMGYELVRLRQELDPAVSIEIRTQALLEQVILRARRLEEEPFIQLVAHVRPMQ